MAHPYQIFTTPDNFITISHMVENCKSSQLFKSVYDDNASGAFCGKIFVEKGAQQTEAYQQNNNLMISKNYWCKCETTIRNIC